MSLIVDRRADAKKKSIVNRQRFLQRFKHQLKKAVNDAASGRSITEINKGEKVTIPARDISEPQFTIGDGGRRDMVHPGNKEFITGDRVQRPKGGKGGRGGKASKDGQGEDDFAFELSRQEFLDFMFEDLELPHLVKKELTRLPDYKTVRAGYTLDGMPTNINVVRSLRGSLARRIAMGGPLRGQLKTLEAEFEALSDDEKEGDRGQELEEEMRSLRTRLRAIPFLDTVDLRYNHRIKQPQPSTQAVMFCLMDVSGSMTQERKDLAKQFFILLYLFLQRNYERIDVVFIRHHTVAIEVEEDEFFHSRETGGTVVSSALNLTRDIIRDRYPSNAWNIYCAQASDGDNWPDDSPGCRAILSEELLPLMQYFAYIEITPASHQRLWQEYEIVKEAHPNFAMQQIDGANDIYPVFRKLFARQLSS
ncbi:MAG: YeaH/YhbH family protein [Pseudomonadota bacterium]